MYFDNSYFEDEVRDGFFVPSEVKHAWAAELEVLSEVDKLCKKHNIKYFADWGTLLATVRHEGFIPWDDDLDIVMKREDYEKFMAIANDELPEGYSAYNYKNHDDFWLFLARVVGKPRICFEDEHLKKFHEFPYIAGVDIFVIDYVSRDELKEDERDKQAMYILALADTIGEGKCSEVTKEKWLEKLEEEYKISIPHNQSNSQLRRSLYNIVEVLFGSFKDSDADELTQLFPFGIKNKKFRFSKECYADSIELAYENTTIPVAIRYCEMLSKKYGDYMKLIRDAGGHDYPYFESQKRQLQAVLDFDMPEFKFKKELLKERTDSDSGNKLRGANKYKTQLLQLKKDLDYVTNQICDKIVIKDKEGANDSIGELFAKAQQYAIDMGTLIEDLNGQGTSIVKKLEEYCELLYQLNISENVDSINNVVDNIKDNLKNVDNLLKEEHFPEREILFVAYKENQFRYIAELLKKYICETESTVNIVVVPYYYKRYDGSYTDVVYEYENYKMMLNNKELFKNVKVLDYNAYNLNIHKPDIIYTQNPYDEWNYTLTLPQEYYCSNLHNYTSELIYVPPFKLEEFSKESERAYHNMKYYCTMPGVIYSDKVYVQSDNMRQLYIEKLSEFAGEETRPIWEGKIEAADYIYSISDNLKCDNKMLFENNGKKKIAFYMQLGVLIQYKEQMLEKLKSVIDIFKENKANVDMVWIFDDIQEKYLVEKAVKYPSIYKEYQDIKQDYIRQQKGLYVHRSDIKLSEIINCCDAYYGNEGHIALEFSMEKKPVMIMAVNCM